MFLVNKLFISFREKVAIKLIYKLIIHTIMAKYVVITICFIAISLNSNINRRTIEGRMMNIILISTNRNWFCIKIGSVSFNDRHILLAEFRYNFVLYLLFQIRVVIRA